MRVIPMVPELVDATPFGSLNDKPGTILIDPGRKLTAPDTSVLPVTRGCRVRPCGWRGCSQASPHEASKVLGALSTRPTPMRGAQLKVNSDGRTITVDGRRKPPTADDPVHPNRR